ncbi:MAG: response regulator, partial [Calditrichaeota bacterium]|nr:response regulator [Calditrichota bacterium]
QIFEPFFTTKGVGEGTGLGLATVYGIVKQNNGFINVYSEPGQGTSFKIYLPRYAGEDQKSATSLPTIPLPGGNEVLLLVEDELAILNLVKRMLQKIGYRVLIAKNAREAVELAEEFSGDIDLLITDVVMPEMNGRDLSYRLQEIQPELKTLFMSGYTANIIAHHGIVDERVNFIQKPFSMEDLAGKVRKALVRED